MSSILDALKKSEQERTIGHVPNLGSVVVPPRQKESSMWLWLLVLLLFLSSTGLAYYYFEAQKNVVVSPLSVSDEAVVNNPLSANKSTSSVVNIESVGDADFKKVFPQQALVTDDTQGESETERGALPDIITEPVQRAEIKAAPVALVVAQEGLAEPAPQVAQEPILLEALPLEVRQRIPALSLDVHVYADTIENRFILLNLKRYGQGQTTREGLLVDEIRSDSVVLSLGDTRFKLLTR